MHGGVLEGASSAFWKVFLQFGYNFLGAQFHMLVVLVRDLKRGVVPPGALLWVVLRLSNRNRLRNYHGFH